MRSTSPEIPPTNVVKIGSPLGHCIHRVLEETLHRGDVKIKAFASRYIAIPINLYQKLSHAR